MQFSLLSIRFFLILLKYTQARSGYFYVFRHLIPGSDLQTAVFPCHKCRWGENGGSLIQPKHWCVAKSVTWTGRESRLSKLCYYPLLLTIITHINERFRQALFNVMFDQLKWTACSPMTDVTSKRSQRCSVILFVSQDMFVRKDRPCYFVFWVVFFFAACLLCRVHVPREMMLPDGW